MADIDICNRALYRIGHTEKVTSLSGSDTSAAAVLCTDLYTSCLEELLEAFDWRFAKLVAVLTEADVADVAADSRPEYAYAYALPANCLVPRELWNGARSSRPEDRYPFELQLSDGAAKQLLFCDVVPDVTAADAKDHAPILKYTAQVTNTAAMPRYFQDALSWKLAAELAMPLSVSAQMANRAAQMFEMSLSLAMEIDARTQQQDEPAQNEFLGART